MEEYITLFTTLSSVSLSSQPDEIISRWTANGQYLVALAFECQFKDAMIFSLQLMSGRHK
jgi:hypothetical protein